MLKKKKKSFKHATEEKIKGKNKINVGQGKIKLE